MENSVRNLEAPETCAGCEFCYAYNRVGGGSSGYRCIIAPSEFTISIYDVYYKTPCKFPGIYKWKKLFAT